MTNEAKISKIQTHFKALSEVAPSLNSASDKLTKTVALLDEALKRLNIGLTVWVDFRHRGDDDPNCYNVDQVGYTKVGGVWGLALRHIWGTESYEDFHEEGPWLFNDATREQRLLSVEKFPEVVERLATEAVTTKKQIEEKTQEVLGLAAAIAPATLDPKKVVPTIFQTGATMRLSELAGPAKPMPKPASLPLQPTMPKKPVSAPLQPTIGTTEGKK